MIQVYYQRAKPVTISSNDHATTYGIVVSHGNNRIYMSSNSWIQTQAGEVLKGPQFMLMQLLFLLDVKITHPFLRMEYVGA